MSTSEAQQVFQILTEIDKLLADIELKIQRIQNNAESVKEAEISLRQGIRALLRFSHLLAHMGFPQEISGAIAKITRFIFMLRMAYMSLTFIAAGTPYGLLMGGAGLMLGSISMGSMLEGY